MNSHMVWRLDKTSNKYILIKASFSGKRLHIHVDIKMSVILLT